MKRQAPSLSTFLKRHSLRISMILLIAACARDKVTEPPIGKIEPVNLEFGQVLVGQAAERSFSLHNAGRSALSGRIDESCPEFALVSGGGAYSLDPGEALVVVVRFEPVDPGVKICTITTGNGAFGSMTCSGTGVVAPTGACCAPQGTCAVTTEAACASPGTWLGAGTVCDPNPCDAPTGSCCAVDGACTVTTEVACAAPAVWTMFADCDPNPCAQPTGSCCAIDGACSVTTEAACAAPAVWTMFADCDPNPCAQPTGSCCAIDGACTVTTEAACAAPAVWTMFADCDPNPCPQPTGSCCAIDGACSVTTEAACPLPSVWTMFADCDPNPCAQPTGSCCAIDGVCSITTEAACAAPAVWTMFAGCDPNPCAQPTGSCCAIDGACAVTTEIACAAPAVWTMFADCDPNPCPQPTGSCCAIDGACTVTTEAACATPAVWTMFADCDPNPCAQPTGACCTPAGSCSITTRASCAAPNVWQGAGTTCVPNPCPQPTGACCTPAGFCSITTQASCVAPNVWQGAGTICAPNPCPQPTGACCSSTGSCWVATQASCTAPHTWQGAGTDCSPNPCPQPIYGACCTSSGSCTVTTEAACTTPHTWHGAGTTCSPNPCPQPPTGACCSSTGSCWITTQAACTAPYTWQGAGTTCSPNPCPQPITGACCSSTGSCWVTTQASCTSPFTWQGAGTICSPNPCPQPITGACCTPSGSCSVTTEASCTAPSTWQGAGTICSPNPCPQPTGACCTPTGTCTVTTLASCSAPNSWRGAGTICSPNPCPPPTIVVSPTSLPGGTLDVPYTQTVTASGGTAPYQFVVSSGLLPTGLALSTGGSITGTPTALGAFTFTIVATDALSFTGSRSYSVTIAAAGGVDLSIPTVYITQSAQNAAFDVPLVQDRLGFLRAFVLASEANALTPQVRVRIYDGGSLIQTYTISAPGSSVPTSFDESVLTRSWNQSITGGQIQAGNSILVDVDPSNLIAESDETNNVWPASGTPWTLDVRDLPVLDMTLVPVNTTSGTGNVSSGNAASFMDYTRRLHPIPDYDALVRATLYSSATLGADGTGWELMLNEVTAQRLADGSSRYYFGVAHVNYTSGVAGLGWMGYPVAVGWDYLPSGSWTIAHEIGHNWDCEHTRCTGGEADYDPAYPYAGGAIGVYGYDLWASSLKDKTTYKDVMSYCNTRWISDYTYKKLLAFRESSPIGFREITGKEPCLLIWGLRRNGRLSMEPAFRISTRPSLPEPGPCRVEGLDADGRVLWSQDFDLMATTHPTDRTSAGFCFAIPMRDALLGETTTIRVLDHGREAARRTSAAPVGPGGLRTAPLVESMSFIGGDLELQWNAAQAPVVMVRDLDRDECIGFARGGQARIATSTHRLELLMSDGVHTTVRHWPE